MEAQSFCTILAEGLDFPEAPLVMTDGTLWLTEVIGGTLVRIDPDGALSRVPVGGGPNGLALAPDGRIIIANNGGFAFVEIDGVRVPTVAAADYDGGCIQAYDPATGSLETLYTHCDGHRLSAPNDLVFDTQGGFYFTDTGKAFDRYREHGGIYYAQPDGSGIRKVVYPLVTPNGIGLSPDGRTLYVAETETARAWAFDIAASGEIAPSAGLNGGRLLAGLGGAEAEHLMIDSLAVMSSGRICLATLLGHRITILEPDGRIAGTVPVPDLFPTNIGFSGDEATAYVTLAATGRVAKLDWAMATAG